MSFLDIDPDLSRTRGMTTNLDTTEPDSPDEDDFYTSDHVHFYSGHKLVLTIQGGVDVSRESMWAQINAHMEHEGWFPNVWFVSDHGNTHLMLERQ